MTMMTPAPLDQEDEEMLVPHSDLVEGPQPMEVAQVEPAASTVESQPVEEPPTMKFTWTIENFARLNTKKHYSDMFIVGGYKWRILIFPKGNNVDYLSMYLDVADSGTLPYGWSRYAHFSLAVVNQIHTKYSIRKDTQHQFNARESDWGFTSFMPLGDLYDPSRGYLVNDTVVVEAEVAVRKVLDYWSYDSKKETGYVGLKNQGATCYMNSLLQTLYHIPYFRKAVYHMPTTENDMPSGSIPLALQSLFYKLQYNDSSVATKELTKSFGWDTYDSFMQHDVQELNRVLCEKLEDKMKGTVVEGTIQQLFEGHHMNYIECINVDYKSTRKESFYDLQLDVKGCRDVYASFDKYVEVERLEGDNKYHAEEHGLQDAKKGVLFIDFPPVLQLQLKRFEYDFMRDTMVKINDRYEFPLQLDLDRENGKYLSPDSDKSVRNLYTLHSVLVHSGGVHGGHYYAFIRPTLSDQWYKFDDERVTKEDVKRALEEQYGGEEELPQTNPGFNNTPFKFTKYSNAYMLVYIRDSDKDKIICNVDEKDIAEHLRIRLKKEQEEKEDKRRYKAQAHLYTIIKVARDEDLAEQIGRDIYFDLVDHDKVRSFRIQKQTPFNLFKEEVAKEFGIPVQFQRFWIWAKRQNHTYRPNRPLTPQEELQSVGHLREVSNKTHNAELKLFLELEFGPDLRPIPLPDKTKEDILLFFKLYEPEKRELRFVGRLFVKSSSKPVDILAKLNQLAGFGPDEEIELYEEIKFEPCIMCEHLDKRTSFRLSQIEDGDIICFQKSTPLESEEECKYPDVPSFLEYVHNRQIVHFRSLEKPKEEDFSLELSKLHTYDDVVEKVARQIGLEDPTKIRLTAHNCYSQQPKPQPIKYRGVEHLTDMLVHYNQSSDILYYEVLDIPLPELQGLKNLKVAFHHATKDEVVIHNIRLPKQSTVGDVINVLKTKVELSHPNAELRLLKVFYHKIYKIFPHTEKIENINDQYWTLRAEEIPEDEKNLAAHDRLIHVYHFTKDTAQNQMQVQNFGEPFFLVINEVETLAEVKVRVQKKLQVPDDEFSKWKFTFLSLGRPEYLQDSDIVSSRFQRRDVYGAWEQYLGLEHSDNAPKRAYAANQNRQTYEKPVIEDPSMKKNIGGQTGQAGEVFVNSVIAAGDLEPPSGGEEDENLAEQPPVEATPSARRKRRESAPAHGSATQPQVSAESPSTPPTRSKRFRKRSGVESDEMEKTAINPTKTSGTDDELREAFEAAEQEKEREKGKEFEEEEEIPTEVTAESIALAWKQHATPGTELTSSELDLFEDAEAEHSSAVEEQSEQLASDPVEQAKLPVAALESVVEAAALESEVEVTAAVSDLAVEVPRIARTAGTLAVMTSPLKPLIAAMPIQSLLGSSNTTSFADPKLAEFEAMDLDAQLDRLEKLSSTPGRAKSKAVDEAVERVKIWQSTELGLDEDREAIDQLMKDLDLLYRQSMAPKPILEISLGLAKDVLNLCDRYEDLKPTVKTFELCKATYEDNLADYAKQKAELDQMAAGYKEAKASADKLEKQIEELQKQLAERREVQRRLGARLSSKTKATFLVQSMVSASRPALEVAEASIHQRVLLQKELSIKKVSLQETLKKLGF